MKVLAINCGSSTLKFQLIETEPEGRLAQGIVGHVGGPAALQFNAGGGHVLEESAPIADHGGATRRVLEWLDYVGFTGPEGIVAVGHRVVHGSDQLVEPTLIDDQVVNAVEALGDLAPLHNAPAISAIKAAREALGPGVPMVATFDTAFHRTVPERASQYAIPQDLAAKHGVRRYGFHGLAHRYMTERYAEIVSRPVEEVKIITLQLGNGCSATAVKGGRSVDTSMGFTPLEGLIMGTRSGDVDPTLVSFLARREGVSAGEVEELLNTQSGLLGVSGQTRDMRELLSAEASGDSRAALAIEMFCYRVRKYVGAYLAVLGGADAIVFGGGIGENAPAVRARICVGMEWCGLTIDPRRNSEAIGLEARISSDSARLHAYIVAVDEAAIIVRDTVECLRELRRK